jgi:hypothetical protein
MKYLKPIMYLNWKNTNQVRFIAKGAISVYFKGVQAIKESIFFPPPSLHL